MMDEHGAVIYRGRDDQGMCDDDDEAETGCERTAGRPEGGTTPAVPETMPHEIVPQDEMPEIVPQDPVPETMPPGRRMDDVSVARANGT